MSDEPRNQEPGYYYYYEPLKDEGTFQDLCEQAGGIVAQAIVRTALTAETGGAWEELPEVNMFIDKAAEAAGSVVGKTMGFYMDNASTVLRNVNTLIEQLNDYRSWTDPFASFRDN
jgi:hypothetical protein